MKIDYLKELRSYLDLYVIDEEEKLDIISDYTDMYDGWKSQGLNDEETEQKLGKPKAIYRELVVDYKKVPRKSSKTDKYIAISPFVSLIIFFVLGFGFNFWVYSWLAFLLIPITAIILEMSKAKEQHIFTALSPFVATIAYFILGMAYGLWHPGWLVFLLIPIVAILVEVKSIGILNTLVSLSPFAAVIIFFYFGEKELWNPGWLVFLIIPALGVLNEKKIWKILIWEITILGGAVAYYYLNDTLEVWGYSLLAFVPLVVWSLSQSDWQVDGEFNIKYSVITGISLVVYVALGLLLGWWGYAWIVFFAVPIYAINKEAKQARVIAISPFVATSLFMTLGYFFGVWEWAWIAFLIIPVTAIIKES